jgi:amidohydrolase
MRRFAFAFVLLPLTLTPALAQEAKSDLAKKVAALVDEDEPRLLKIFKHCHANPEIGFQEVKTAALIEKEWNALGYDVHAGIGTTGVVAVFKNGPGPVVMFRGDMDALPVRETTGLDYASRATYQTAGGGFGPVMHACGHDAHITYLIGLAKLMKELKSEWSGTLVLVAQPAEELILGATAMVKDGLYKHAPKPDILISSHVGPRHPIGSASVKAGRRMAGTDQMDVVFHGVGGHGSSPHTAKEPIVMGSLAVLAYHSIVSRSVSAQEPTVLTVTSFQSGDSNNVIADTATLKLNLRWFDPKVRLQMIEDVKRVTDSIAVAAGMPKDKMPTYVMRGTSGPVVNDDELTQRAEPALRMALGKDMLKPGPPPVMGSEDFQLLAEPYPETKILFISIGCGPADLEEQAKKGNRPAGNHNPNFKVELPAIASGMKANAMVLLEMLKK